jgi:hypothetical protein
VCDVNDDGHLDFIALISQEHEVIEAYVGKGTGLFNRNESVRPASSWGSSGVGR